MFDLDDTYQLDSDLLLKKEILFKAYFKYASYIKKEQNLSMDNISLQEMDLLFKIFNDIFNPDNVAITTNETHNMLQVKLFEDVKKSTSKLSSNESLIIANLLNATIRTNFYQNNTVIKKSSDFSIVIKFDSKVLQSDFEFKYEIFVYNRFFEGVHFREKAISRGGLRFSSREDYFEEIFNLAKTQKYKNSMIIEGGAKGGFIIKSDYNVINNNTSKEEQISTYKDFLSSLISIMDNKDVEKNDFSTASYIVALDEEDSYLFIAADKGTGNFLDYANGISIANKFWLKDAFATGSSSGYNHKKLQITSKGALIATEHHAKMMGLDIYNDSITVVGVGGMSGDVFGNAMIMLNKIKLVAAFNHSYIFIDPNPNVDKSFLERARLFKESLSWNYYNLNTISTGGGLFKISDDNIKLSNEIKKLLKITNDALSGEELMQEILKMQVDMLFFGGVNTYVTSKSEYNESEAKVLGSELKAKIITEGANLALTQKARIEFAAKGGMINTDFIDNCLGVCCSDYEVNLKLLNTNDKNILSASEEEVIKKLETLAINKNIGIYLEVLYSNLFTKDYEQYLTNFKFDKFPLLRPEAAILNSSVINYLKSIYCDLQINNKYLYDYFPESMHKIYKSKIDKYVFKKEIAFNLLINKLINTLGSYYIFKHANINNVNEREIIKKCIEFDIKEEIFDTILANYTNEKIILKNVEQLSAFLKKSFKSSAKTKA